MEIKGLSYHLLWASVHFNPNYRSWSLPEGADYKHSSIWSTLRVTTAAAEHYSIRLLLEMSLYEAYVETWFIKLCHGEVLWCF